MAALVVPFMLALPLCAGATPPQRQVHDVEQTFSAFFDPHTSLDQRVQLLQNGKRFEKILERQEKLPVAEQTTAVANDVQVHGDRANVNYTIEVNGHPALRNQKGTAVKEGGRWRISERTFCDIESMRGSPPAGCRDAGQ